MRSISSTQSRQARKILKSSWQRLRKSNPTKWSLRNLARKSRVSPGFLSKVLSGKKSLPPKLALRLAELMSLDELSVIQVSGNLHNSSLNSDVMDTVDLAPMESEWLLGRWYRLALLDLMTTDDFQNDVSWMARRLGISTHEIERSLRMLEQEGLAKKNKSGNWQKTSQRLRFPTTTSKEVIRNHHKAQIKKALLVLENQLTPVEFKKRLIMGITLACNPANLEKIKVKLQNALYEAAVELSDGACTEVYQMNLQLFQVTKRSGAYS